MFCVALAASVALFVWWLSTGIILLLDGMPRRTFGCSMLGATVLAGAGLFGIGHFRNDASVTGAFAAFCCSIAIWGWLEMSFLMGYVTGPRKRPCASTCTGLRHFGHAVQAILYHEMAIIVSMVAVFALCRNAVNQVGAESIAILWVMRASAKLNLFFGVRNLSAELLPPQMAYLSSFFRQRPMNFLFPFSVTAGSVLATLLIRGLFAPGASDFSLTSGALLATLAVLGVLEHWILVLPFPATALWSWSLRSREAHGT